MKLDQDAQGADAFPRLAHSHCYFPIGRDVAPGGRSPVEGGLERQGREGGVLHAKLGDKTAPGRVVIAQRRLVVGDALARQTEAQRQVAQVGVVLVRVHAFVAHPGYRGASIPRTARALGAVRDRPDCGNQADQAEGQEPATQCRGDQERSRMMLLASSTEAVQVGGTTVVESYSSMMRGPDSEWPARLGRSTTGVSAQPRLGPK